MKKLLLTIMGSATVFTFSLGLLSQDSSEKGKQHSNVIQSMSVGDYGG